MTLMRLGAAILAVERRQVIPFIDLARSVAPLLVLWAHLGPRWCAAHGESCLTAGSLWSPIQVTTWLADRLSLNGNGAHVGVLLFFLVSGFIISHIIRFETRGEFAIKRVFRLAPMLIGGLLFAYAASIALKSVNLPPTLGFEARSFGDLLLSITLLDTIIPSPITSTVTWSLVPEVGFYATLVMIWPALVRRPLQSTYLMIALAALIDISTRLLFPFKPANYFFIQIEFILIGRAIYLWWAGIISRRSAASAGLTALAVFAGLHFLAPYSKGELLGVGSYSVTISWAFALVIFMLLMQIRNCPRILHFVSDRSYSIYLLHVPVGSVVLNVLCLRFGWPIQWVFPMGLLATLAISHATYKLVEVPGQRLGRRIAAQFRRPVPVATAVVVS